MFSEFYSIKCNFIFAFTDHFLTNCKGGGGHQKAQLEGSRTIAPSKIATQPKN